MGEVQPKLSGNNWLYNAYQLAAELIEIHDPLWAGTDRDFVIQFAKMKPGDTCPKHTDRCNMAPAYALSMGCFYGGELMCQGVDGTPITMITRHALVKFEGRRPHWVSPFSSTRYSLIWYKKWDRRWTNEQPIMGGPTVKYLTPPTAARHLLCDPNQILAPDDKGPFPSPPDGRPSVASPMELLANDHKKRDRPAGDN